MGDSLDGLVNFSDEWLGSNGFRSCCNLSGGSLQPFINYACQYVCDVILAVLTPFRFLSCLPLWKVPH